MPTQVEQANLFKTLHVKGDPLIVFNVWDAGSAKALAEVGARAIGTGSHSVAEAFGFNDGENIPLELVIANARRIVSSTSLPVSIDFEGGYGSTADELQGPITQLIATGAVGINFEDQIVGGTGLYSIEEQCERIKAIREASDRASVPLFINARTDIFLKARVEDHNEAHLDEALLRVDAYSKAGASGFFAAGLINETFIERLCSVSPLPVNILVRPNGPSNARLAELGVARISYGSGPWSLAMNALKEAGRIALSKI